MDENVLLTCDEMKFIDKYVQWNRNGTTSFEINRMNETRVQFLQLWNTLESI